MVVKRMIWESLMAMMTHKKFRQLVLKGASRIAPELIKTLCRNGRKALNAGAVRNLRCYFARSEAAQFLPNIRESPNVALLFEPLEFMGIVFVSFNSAFELSIIQVADNHWERIQVIAMKHCTSDMESQYEHHGQGNGESAVQATRITQGKDDRVLAERCSPWI
jgi:hypothetical protein